MGSESFDVFTFDLGRLLQGQIWVIKLKSDYNLLIIGPIGLRYEMQLHSMQLHLTLGPSLKVRRG